MSTHIGGCEASYLVVGWQLIPSFRTSWTRQTFKVCKVCPRHRRNLSQPQPNPHSSGRTGSWNRWSSARSLCMATAWTRSNPLVRKDQDPKELDHLGDTSSKQNLDLYTLTSWLLKTRRNPPVQMKEIRCSQSFYNRWAEFLLSTVLSNRRWSGLHSSPGWLKNRPGLLHETLYSLKKSRFSPSAA